MATPAQIIAAINHADDINDQFYNTLAPVLSNWGAVCAATAVAIPESTGADTKKIDELMQRGNQAIHDLADASIYLGQELKALAARY